MRNLWNHTLIVFFLFLCVGAFSSYAERPIRVLSIDGGGVRGIIPAVVLSQIEQELQKPIASIFDLIAGSSTGGIIALGLAAPDKEKKPIQTAADIVSFYKEQGSTVFGASWAHWLKNLGGLVGPKYESTGLVGILNDYLGDTMLSESLTPILITGYHLDGQTGIEFCSEEAKKFPQDKNCLMREVGLATAAAPVYFDAANVRFDWGSLEGVADGCIYKLNPAMVAYTHAQQIYPGRVIEVYSLGTGKISAEDVSGNFAGRGVLHWIGPALRHLFNGNIDADDSTLHKMLNKGMRKKYFRLNPHIGRDHSSLDDVSEQNIDYLYEKAIKLTKSSSFKEMLKRLKKYEE